MRESGEVLYFLSRHQFSHVAIIEFDVALKPFKGRHIGSYIFCIDLSAGVSPDIN